jgi:PAS domain S-box-containing protein
MEADKNKPHLSRAAAAAHRRLSASEARRKPASEVMLVSSKSFPSQQYQELLTFIKGLQLPPDVTLLFTTVPNERVAERKAALAAQSSEHVDDMLQAAGSKLALLSQLKSDLGLSGTPTPMSSFGSSFDAPLGSPPPLPTLPPTSKVSVYEAYSQEMSTPPVPAARTKGTGGGTATGSGEGGGRLGSGSGSTTDAPPGSKSSSPPSQPLAGHVGASPQRVTLTETHFGTGSNSGGAGFAINLDALPAPAFVCDATGVVHGWNAAIQQLTGWPVDAVRGKRLVDVLVPEDTRKHVHDCLVRSRAADSAVRLQTADGRLLDLQVRLSNFALPPSAETSDAAAASSSVSSVGAAGIAGTSLPREGVLAVGVDVTSLLGRAAAASQEVHDLKRLIDCANAPIFGINAMSLITEWNRKATQITGRTKWEVVGRRLEDFIQPEDRASVVEVLDNALRGKETANFEFPLYTKSKERVEILLNAATRRDANNEIVGVVGVGQDITELNRGKAELGRVANDLKMLIESANAPILGVDTSGCINEWNKKAAELTGYTAQEMKGCQLVEAGPVKEEFKASVRQVLTHAMNGIDSTNFELPLYARNGQRVELSLNATTRHSAKGEVVGVVMVGQDITGKKDVEKAQIAAAKARAASDAKGTFMASMSHEMRTPLNGVLGMLQLALELDLPPKGLKYAQNAMMSAQHLMNLVNDILDISKIEAGKLELEQRVFNVHEVLHAAVEIVKVNALNKRVRIEIDIDDSLPVFVVGDQQRLRQVLLNLLFNAVKFTPQGRIVVTAARQAEFANHLRLQMAVEDTGIGIREEDIRHLFGLFSKIRDKRVENPLGVGLGLAICKQLVELMRGQIHVVSEYGRGTKFFFNLLVGKAGSPQIEAHQRQAAEQRASTELISVDMVGKNVGRVLVVEDNEFNIEVVRCMLDNAGHTVGMAMNGVEGIEAWQAARERGEPYDAVLMDCNMPLMDGYEATRRIRAKLAEEAEVTGQRTTETLPIIALTAYAMPGDKEKCLNAGMSDYITKPVNRDVLISTVLKHMRLHWHHEKERALETKQRGGASITPERQRPVLERPSGGYAGVAGRGVDQQRSANSLPSTSRALTLAGSNGKGGRAMDSHGFVSEFVSGGGTFGGSGSSGSGSGAGTGSGGGAKGGKGVTAPAQGDERRKSKASEKANASGGGSGDGARPSASAGLEDVAHVDEPFNRSAALDNYQGPGGELLLSRMEEEFVAKSGVLVGRMTVAAAQDDMAELSHELETLLDFSHMLRARGLTEALGTLERAIAENQPAELKKTLRTVDVAAQRVRSYIVRGPDPKQQTGAAATGDRAAVEAWVMAEKSRQRTRAFSYEEVPQSRGGFSSRSLVSNLSETPVAPPHPPPSVNATPTVTWRSNNIAVPTMHEWMNYSAAAEHYSSAALGAAAGGGSGDGGGSGAGGCGASGSDSRLSGDGEGSGSEISIDRKAVAGPISAFVQRGEMMVERMQVLATKGDYKAIKREAGRMEDTATKLGNVQLKQLSRELAEAAGRANGEDIHRILDVVQQRLNIIMNYSVRGMLVYNTLTELSEDLRLAARSDAATAHKLLLKATSEFGQLSDYLAGLRHLPLPGGTDDAAHAPAAESEPAASASPAAEPEASDALQCKSVVASCVHNGKEMLEAMVRELLHGTLHHTAACRLVADTFLAVVGDLGQAAESDQMAVVSERIERVNSQFFHISDLIARNKMVTGKGPTHPTSPATPQQHKLSGGKFGAVDVHASDEWWLLNTRRRRAASVETPVVDEQQALRQFGGDLSFLRQMCAKFVASGRGVIERIQGLIEALSLGAASTTPMQDRYTELRRVAHSLKGAASTIGAMRLSQAALDLQLAAESESAISSLNDLSQQVLLQFEMVCAAIDPESGELDASKVEGPTRLVPSVPEPPAPAKGAGKDASAGGVGKQPRPNPNGRDNGREARGDGHFGITLNATSTAAAEARLAELERKEAARKQAAAAAAAPKQTAAALAAALASSAADADAAAARVAAAEARVPVPPAKATKGSALCLDPPAVNSTPMSAPGPSRMPVRKPAPKAQGK